MADNPAWTRHTGRTEHEIIEVPPTHCPAGHPLGRGHVIVGGDSHQRTYLCRQCGLMVIRDHDDGTETVVQRSPT